MKTVYISEIEGMYDFYNELQLVPSYELNTDGVINGTLLEFKKSKSIDGGVGKHKEQIQRYLKAYNSAAKSIPSISLLIYLNTQEYIKIDNLTNTIIKEGNWRSPLEFKDFLINNNNYLKGYIDEFSIVAYNNEYCSNKKNASKEDVKKEFENPSLLNIEPFDWKQRLLEEIKEPNKIGWLHFNMNQLGNTLLKKQLGAFFTPKEYVEISTRYVRNAIKRSIELGYEDYIIVDRCAGTGNLERFFHEKELKHFVLNTYDYTEWTTLKGLYEGRVKLIIPPTNQSITSSGLLKFGDALSYDFNYFLTDYLNKLDRNKIYIIFLENPPFRDETSTLSDIDKKSKKTKNYISDLMNKDSKIKGAMKNELSIKFIWSAWNLFNPNEYVLFSPIKYWKVYHLFDYKIFGGFISNKKDYNAHYDAGLPIINWSNQSLNFDQKQLNLENGVIKKIDNSIKILLDKKKRDNPIAYMFIMAGELRPIGTSLDNGNQVINDTPAILNEDNILEQLPLWAAAKYETKDLELNILMKSGDGGKQYLKDKKFLKDCFIWSCLTNKNKCISILNYKINEMALLQQSRCDLILEKLNLNNFDNILLNKWSKILDLAKKTEEFNLNIKYGFQQIINDINVKEWKGSVNKKNEKIMEYKYADLNALIFEFKKLLKNFYSKAIEPKIIKYELIK